MIFKKIVWYFLPLVLVGCATPYQPYGLNGGYRELKLREDTYRVLFRASSETSSEAIQTYLLRRCAELTLQDRYKYFIILPASSDDNTSPITIKTVGSGNFNSNEYANTNYSAHGQHNHSSITTIDYGRTYIVTDYESGGYNIKSAIIKMFKTDRNIPNVLDAELIWRSTNTLQF